MVAAPRRRVTLAAKRACPAGSGRRAAVRVPSSASGIRARFAAAIGRQRCGPYRKRQGHVAPTPARDLGAHCRTIGICTEPINSREFRSTKSAENMTGPLSRRRWKWRNPAAVPPRLQHALGERLLQHVPGGERRLPTSRTTDRRTTGCRSTVLPRSASPDRSDGTGHRAGIAARRTLARTPGAAPCRAAGAGTEGWPRSPGPPPPRRTAGSSLPSTCRSSGGGRRTAPAPRARTSAAARRDRRSARR